MSASDTKERILEAAEHLFARGGLGALSLRATTAAAGVNVAAVNYHFGCKDALLQALVHRFFGPMTARQLLRLDRLEAAAREPDIDDLLAAFVDPIAELLREQPERAAVLARLVGDLLWEQGGEIRRLKAEAVREVDSRYLRAFQRALPRLSPDELRWRFRSMIGVLVVSQSGLQVGAHRPEGTGDGERGRAWLLTLLRAAFQAPATVPPRPPRTTWV